MYERVIAMHATFKECAALGQRGCFTHARSSKCARRAGQGGAFFKSVTKRRQDAAQK
ncbi:hypothetical protein OAN61_00460 [bacterium]|nr:hypothetical protein [bacterium]